MRSFIEYIFIIYLFGVLNADTILHKLSQIKISLTLTKSRFTSF
jgi:hypothetical protein